MTEQNWRTHGRARFQVVERLARPRFAGLGVAMLFLVAAPGCQAAAARAQIGDTTATAAPDLTAGAQQFPEEDAINLRWEQHWTVEPDGTVHRREHHWTKLLNSRPIRRLADPRIDFCKGQDRLIIHTAQSILPDGTVMPVPDYSFNLAAPDDVGRWPHFAAWQQQVICFSGVVDGVVLELDYEVVTQPGVLPWIGADLRLDDDYPTLQRVVSVTVPQDSVLQHRVDGITAERSQPVETTGGGMTTFSWTFENLPGTPAEPQSPPWQQRCARLRFSTCTSAAWVALITKRVEQAAQPTESIKEFAEAAVEDEADPIERVRKLAGKLRDSFNYVSSPKTYREIECRPAADVLRSNYGNPLESAALCTAALRALGLEVSIEVAVDAKAWHEQVPTNSALAGLVVVADLPDGPVRVHPQHGVVTSPGSFGEHWLLALTESGALRSTYLEARGEKKPSEIHITGKLKVDAEGKAAGELRIRLTGAFYDPEKLQTAAKQEALVKSMVGRVLSDFTVADHSIATLSDEVLRATANVASTDTLKSYGAHHVLTFGAGPAFLNEFPLPLGRSYRKTAVPLDGEVRENVDLTIELPEGWTAAAVPASLSPVRESWGRVAQVVEVEGQTVRFRRTVHLTTDTIAPDGFATLREAINSLRAAQSLHLVCGKSPSG